MNPKAGLEQVASRYHASGTDTRLDVSGVEDALAMSRIVTVA